MITLAFRFASGTLHAAPWTTQPDPGEIEWPPHPARILQSLARGWLTDDAQATTFTAEEISDVLRFLSAPPTFVLPRAMSGRTQHAGTFAIDRSPVPVDSILGIEGSSTVEAYAVWPDTTLTDAHRLVLEESLAGVQSLGTGSSVRLRLGEAPSRGTAHTHYVVTPIEAGRSVARGFAMIQRRGVIISDTAFARRLDAARAAREIVVPWSSQSTIRYAVPLDDVLVREQALDEDPVTFAPATLRFALSGDLPDTGAILAVAEAMRGATLACFSRLHGRPASHRLAGKGFAGTKRTGHDHPYFLPRCSDSQIDAIDVYLPSGCSHQEHRALTSVTSLYDSARLRSGLGVRLVGTAEPDLGRRWRSATPVVLDRFPKRRPSDGSYIKDSPEEQVRTAIERRGYRTERLWVSSPYSLRGRRQKTSAPPAVEVEVELSHEVRGPLLLGSLAHFGLGRFETVDS